MGERERQRAEVEGKGQRESEAGLKQGSIYDPKMMTGTEIKVGCFTD